MNDPSLPALVYVVAAGIAGAIGSLIVWVLIRARVAEDFNEEPPAPPVDSTAPPGVLLHLPVPPQDRMMVARDLQAVAAEYRRQTGRGLFDQSPPLSTKNDDEITADERPKR